MRKIFVLDTSVLVYDPNCFTTFTGNDVLIPITVLDELDKIKKFANESGKNARVSIRILDEISNQGEIHNGIPIDGDIILKIDASAYGSIGVDPTYGDSKILACAAKCKDNSPDSKVILVSKDINLRTRAKAFGLVAQDYNKDKIPSNDLYEGFQIIKDEDAGEALKVAEIISVDNYPELNDLYPNECVVFVGNDNRGLSVGKKIKNQIKLVKDKNPWGLDLRNKEQLFAAELLLDTSIPLVTIIGRAGSGKTLLSVACGLDLVLEKGKYDSFIIYRPIQPMGNDLGYLPGTLNEKLDPWFTPIDDAFAFLFSDKSRKKDGWKSQLHQYITNGTIQKEALTYIRGRSIPNAFILIDECQNLSKEEVKTILTRAGTNTKIVLTGDISQIDNSYLDATNNGLTYAVEKFKESPLAGHITFNKGERSPLATVAADIL